MNSVEIQTEKNILLQKQNYWIDLSFQVQELRTKMNTFFPLRKNEILPPAELKTIDSSFKALFDQIQGMAEARKEDLIRIINLE